MQEPTFIVTQLQRSLEEFRKRFGRPAKFAAVAPGRVNLIGEHTDYNDGFVMPIAIEHQTLIVADRAPTANSRTIRLQSTQLEGVAEFQASLDLQPGQPDWANYVKGVVLGCLRKGLDAGGFDALIDSTVPVGSGLSSSAALEVSTATLIEAMTGKSMDRVEKALLAQKAEHEFPKVPCGIMDQFISALGQAGQAMLLDCRTYTTTAVPLNDPSVSILVSNSNVKHALTGGEYAERRSQCFAAAKALNVKSLRDATMPQLLAAQSKLDDMTFRRARHVISEIDRTLRAAEAAKQGDWATFGQRMVESHNSLRDDFEVSCEELDVLVELAMAIGPAGGVLGSRMTGGGFGGCTVSIVRTNAIDAVTKQIAAGYKKRTGIEASIFASRPAAGARILKV